MNKYLVKIAAQQNSDTGQISKKTLALGATTAALAGSLAPSRLLGYHNVYHGTSKVNAEKIRAEGLNPKFGGTGAAASWMGAEQEDLIRKSSGKVHVTKLKPVAKFFAGFGGDVKAGLRPTRVGEVLSMKVPHSIYDKMEVDKDVSSRKGIASHGTEKIDSKFVQGAKDYGGRSQFLNKAHLKDYLSTSPGKNRFLRGAGLAAAGVAGAALVGHELSKLRGRKPTSDS